MPKCDISLELKRQNLTYHPGDDIEGTVRLWVNEDCKCNGLTVTLRWFTEGKGRKEVEVVAVGDLFQGDLRAGEQHSFDFAVPTPKQPCTYAGTNLSINWHLEARADLPWAKDPKAQVDIIVRPRVDDVVSVRRAERGETEVVVLNLSELSLERSKFYFIGPIIGLFIIGLSIVFINESMDVDNGSVFASSMLLAVGVVVLFLSLKKLFAHAKVGNVTLDVHQESPGSPANFQLYISGGNDVDKDAISGYLQVIEKVVRGGGDNQVSFHEIRHSTKLCFEPSSGSKGYFTANFDDFVDKPMSFRGGENTIVWQLTLDIDLEKTPQWNEIYPLWAELSESTVSGPYR